MARKIIWSFEATADLEAIADYIARDSSFYAASFVIEVREASRSLNEFSERGRIVPELSNPSIRELFIKDYRLIYRIEESRVDILGLIHGRAEKIIFTWSGGKDSAMALYELQRTHSYEVNAALCFLIFSHFC